MPDFWMDVDTALSEVPVNIMPLLDDTDFTTRETAVAYNAAGMDLVWNFVTTGGAFTQTAVTPTTGGDYDWTHQGDGIYTIEIPASGGASINNDTEGFGWFSGVATGVLPWRGPTIGFRAAALNNSLIDGTTIDVNTTAISGSATAADNLEASALTIITGQAQTGTLSTTQMTTDLSEATNDHYNGRIIIWTSGNMIGQATDITDYAGTNGLLTFTAVTEAPANGDNFIII